MVVIGRITGVYGVRGWVKVFSETEPRENILGYSPWYLGPSGTPRAVAEGHPLWSLDNCLVTPHVANTHEMLRPRLARLVADNVRRFGAGEPLLGRVDPALGY